MRLEIKTGICQVCILNVLLQNNRNLLSNRLETVVSQPQFCELCEECFPKPCPLSWVELESGNSKQFPGDTMLLAQGPHFEDDCPRAGSSFALLKMGCCHVPWTQLWTEVGGLSLRHLQFLAFSLYSTVGHFLIAQSTTTFSFFEVHPRWEGPVLTFSPKAFYISLALCLSPLRFPGSWFNPRWKDLLKNVPEPCGAQIFTLHQTHLEGL